MDTQSNDNSYRQEHLDLISKVLLSNGLDLDPSEYVLVDVIPVFDEADLLKGNSILQLAPLVTNDEIENLNLFYDRQDIAQALQSLTPSIFRATTDNSLDELIDYIKLSIRNEIPLSMDDFFNTFVAIDEDTNVLFVELHALASSFFYTGVTRVLNKDSRYDLAFDIEYITKP